MSDHTVGRLIVTAALLALVPAAHAANLYVANNGADSPTCGPKPQPPCRSITQAIQNAAPGDKIVVGPGTYGDLNGNGTLGETGEETPSPGCGCMLSFNKAVTLVSSQGAAATVIDARSVTANTNVLLITSGADFGKPKKGFTVTTTANDTEGMVIDSANVKIRGNQVMRTGGSGVLTTYGIDSLASSSGVLIEGNQVTGWTFGIDAKSDATVRKNLASLNDVGIDAGANNLVIGNVVTGNVTGLDLEGGAATTRGNAVYGNAIGIKTSSNGPLEKNNIFGNLNCGLSNIGIFNLPAAHNYWGAATGPGNDPADAVCDNSGGVSIVTPFATKPFAVRAIKP
jgi:hypothetical protein